MKQDQQEKSPFAALTPQEQKEQWICWQAAHQKPQEPEKFPDLRLPEPEPKRPAPPVPPMPVSRHGQYDAIIRRMKQARQHAQCDHSWD